MTISIPETIRVLLPGGVVRRMALENYVGGVVTAALPADAPLEALKAQAVAARTFGAITRRHIERGADVCTLRHCQLWKEPTAAAARRASDETSGIVAIHDGRLIDAYYFEHCDGNTRDAKGILIQVPPYLRSVTCACGFATLKGHGIGMCQRGAQVMARFGDTFDVILKHYFRGIDLERASETRTFVSEPKTPPTEAAEPSSGALHQDQLNRPERHSEPRRSRPAKGTFRTPRKGGRETPTQPSAQLDALNTTSPTSTLAPSELAAPLETDKPSKAASTPGPESTATGSTSQATEAASISPPAQPKTTAETPSPTELPPPHPATPPVEPVEPTQAATADTTQPTTSPEKLGEPQEPARSFQGPEATQSSERVEAPTADETASARQDESIDSTPPPTFPEAIGLLRPPSRPTSREPSGEIPEEDSVSWYPVADEIVMGAAEFQTEMVEEATEAAEALEETPRTIPLPPPDSLPEEMPAFPAEEATIAAQLRLPPPSLLEEEPFVSTSAPKPSPILIDRLPGPCMIVGDLVTAGIIITIRDAEGHAVVTVSGAAPHHGPGGFEAPLADGGTYTITFDHNAVQVNLDDETLFIQRPPSTAPVNQSFGGPE
jgi:Stage II sporulation protein